jgi:hypothetical protein
VTLVRSGDLAPTGQKTAMLADLCHNTCASVLRVDAGGSLRYLDPVMLAGAGITVEVATYAHPPYEQGPGPFTPNLAALDLIMHTGRRAINVLKAGSLVRPWASWPGDPASISPHPTWLPCHIGRPPRSPPLSASPPIGPSCCMSDAPTRSKASTCSSPRSLPWPTRCVWLPSSSRSTAATRCSSSTAARSQTGQCEPLSYRSSPASCPAPWPACRPPASPSVLDQHEGDDVIATLARAAVATGRQVTCHSGDRDLYQLLDDPGVTILTLARVTLTATDIHRRYGVLARQWPDYRALTGDPATTFPGIRGVGPKTAAALLADGAHLDDLRDSPRLRNARGHTITRHWRQLLTWRDLIRLDTNTPCHRL